ncbi:endonuclease [Moheibacter sediminis]|uniref:Por secretion system C-terminal sorting domain-containing protein n=1 Tax=Moheibacter sediminis TaxID=1434700 RepID=A0A1W2BFG9_9FLAO|nr:endonuclease [Moheibacter sediminis]SMC71725.1 Por secretion system C-terminal sorting domain-containing protein [Moheibacter sediminis]
MRKLLLIFLPLTLFAQIPNYYQGIDFSQTSSELQSDLAALVTATHTHELVYTPQVWNALRLTDLDPENPLNVFLVYGYDDTDDDFVNDRTRDKTLSCHNTDCDGKWVREHVFPKSLGNPSFQNTGPGSDAHSIRSVDYTWNNSRSNRKFTYGQGNSHITDNGLFYPGDEWKGDVARMMMYMHIRYAERCKAGYVGTSSYTYHHEMPDIFLQWNAEDPVSEHELVRNEVLQDMQGNRNPFIDNPYLATLIWGGDAAENTWFELSVQEEIFAKTQIYPNPASDILNINSNKTIRSVSLFTTIGNRIYNKEVYKTETQLQLNQYESGAYILLIVYTDNTKETRKVIFKH